MTSLSEFKQEHAGGLELANRIPSGLIYFLVGGSIGATTALLFAPKAGTDLRHDISDVTRKGLDETKELANEMKEHSADLYHSFKDRADTVLDLAAAKFAIERETGANDDASAGTDNVSNGKTRRPHNGPGRRSAGIV